MWVKDNKGDRTWIIFDSTQELSDLGNAIEFLINFRDLMPFVETSLAALLESQRQVLEGVAEDEGVWPSDWSSECELVEQGKAYAKVNGNTIRFVPIKDSDLSISELNIHEPKNISQVRQEHAAMKYAMHRLLTTKTKPITDEQQAFEDFDLFSSN